MSGAVTAVAGCNAFRPALNGSPAASGTPGSPVATTTDQIAPETVTAYAALSPRGKRLVRRLLENTAIEVAEDRIPERLEAARYVRHEDTVYELVKTATNQAVAVRSVRLEPVSEGEVNTSELVTYGDLLAAGRTAVVTAIEEGRYTVRNGSPPEQLAESRYLSYDGDYYALTTTTGDVRVWRLTLRPAKDG